MVDSLEAEQWLQAFGSRVRDLRSQQGISQADLAHAADLHPTYLSGIERGRRNVSLINIRQIARALGVGVDSLFDEPDQSPAHL